jgi:hypothetical protein
MKMKKILIIFLISTILTACYSSTNTPTSTDSTNAISNALAPRPEDSALTRGPVYLDSTDLLTMESFPLQFALGLKGNLPTPCHQLRISSNGPDAQNQIHLDVYSVVDPNVVCAEVLEPFELNFPLGSYPSGHYILFVNEAQVAEFDA